ncbi:MAG TPA: outer membrane protein assembly factor BamA [Terriglobia bacterium]|jgi:outer membrane protein insertion porin family
MKVASALLAILLSAMTVQALQSFEGRNVETVEVRGNRRVVSDTIKFHIRTRQGAPLNMDLVRRDVKELYAQNYFDDIRVDVEDGRQGGVIVIFTVKEKPMIRSVDFIGADSITRSDILDKLKDKKISVGQETPYDAGKIKQVESVIKGMLAEKGHQDAKVDTTVEDIPPNSIKLTFKINEGPAIKIQKIAIEGNHVYTSRQLKSAMKLEKETGPITVFTSKDTYYDLKLLDDVTRIKIFYADRGYIRVNVLDPIVDVKPKVVHRTLPLIKPPFPYGIPLPWWKKKVNRYYITLKIEENDQYKIGDVKVTGNKEFNEAIIRLILGLVPGQVYNESAVKKGFDNLKKLYGQRGYVNFTAVPLQDLDEEKKLVNLTINVDEDRQFTVNRIAFSGNTTTRDKVIRREVLVDEGQIFNSQSWDFSLLRLNQLGYFEEIKQEDAEIKPSTTDNTIDINLKVKEKSRNSIGFSGGVSAIGGSFLGLNYTTNNFLGLGESLALVLQGGTRQSQYQLNFTEPYLYDRPITLGMSLYNTSYRYDQAKQLFGASGASLPQGLGLENSLNFEQKHTGFSISTGYPMRVFQRIGISYVLDNSSTTGVNPATQAYFSAVQSQNQNFLTGSSFTNFEARRVLPSYTYSTVNNPYNPKSGKSFTLTFEFTGGFLGGTINFYRPSGDFRYYHPMNHGRNTFAMRAMTSYIQSFTNLSVPFYERFFAGGDFDIRGFDFRTLSPISFITRALPVTNPLTGQTSVQPFDDIVYVGGDTQAVFNFEYRIPLVGQTVSMVPFMDMGNAWVTKPEELTRIITVPGETQVLPAQFLPGTNSGLRMSTGLEFQVIMPVLNAPFRIDYALNPFRIDGTFTGPVTGIPFAIHQPAHNFKFTVGRTF